MRNKDRKSRINKTHLTIILLFLVMLYLPTIIFPVVKDKIGEDTSENRALASKPDLKIETIDSYPKNFDKYYNDHLPFRSAIKTAWNYLNVYALRSSTSEKVLFGKGDGGVEDIWMFYKAANDGNPVRAAQGYSEYSNEEMDSIKDKINNTSNELNKMGIEYYILIAPNKENIYKDYLPDTVSIADDEGKVDKLVKYLHENGVRNLIYPKKELIDGRETAPTYYKQDTHWNAWGGYIGFREFLKVAEPDGLDGDVRVEMIKGKKTEDLAKMLGFDGVTNEDLSDVRFSRYTEYETDILKTRTDIVITANNNPLYEKKILLVGDSFRTALLEYCAKTYESCIFMHKEDYRPGMINQYSPDIVISENVERYIEEAIRWTSNKK